MYPRRERVQLLSSVDFCNRFLEPPHMAQIQSVPAVGRRVARISFDGSLELRSCLLPFPFILLANCGQCYMWFCECFVNRDSFRRILYRLWISEFWRDVAVPAEQEVRVCES